MNKALEPIGVKSHYFGEDLAIFRKNYLLETDQYWFLKYSKLFLDSRKIIIVFQRQVQNVPSGSYLPDVSSFSSFRNRPNNQ